jgi:hypothetical protein
MIHLHDLHWKNLNMNIKRAGKQQQACFRSERRYKKQWNADYHWSDVDKLIQGHAAGWIAGVAWAWGWSEIADAVMPEKKGNKP